MKKNKFMRLASILLVLTLLTTCGISGTFAKYVTSATASDTARVAKWGVEIATWNTDKEDASVFATSYETDNQTVVSSDTDKLVAPGTKNETGVVFSIKGTPEVDFKLDFVMNVTSDVVVPAGDYLDWTTGNSTTDTFTVDADYYPVVFTLTQTKSAEKNFDTDNPSGKVIATGNLETIQTEFNKLSKATVEANTELDEEWTLTWAWDFDANGAGTNDKADTLLGNKAAGIATDEGVKTTLTYDISITATQID